MSENTGPKQVTAEIATALVIALFAAIVIAGSIKAGIGWGAEGPRAGFFPFYIGLALLVASGINFWNARSDGGPRLLAEWPQLRHVFSVIWPSVIYVGAMPFTGFYVASTLFIAYFMRRLGHYRWAAVIGVSIGMPLVTYVIFEKWFLVPLPKGPLEEWLGL